MTWMRLVLKRGAEANAAIIDNGGRRSWRRRGEGEEETRARGDAIQREAVERGKVYAATFPMATASHGQTMK